MLSSVVAPVTAGERQRSVVGEAVVWAGAEVRYGHPDRIAAAPSGVGEVPQVERAIVDDAVIAADELHEAGDSAVVDDAGVVASRKGGGRIRKKEGSGLATARSDKAPMLPKLFRVAVPPPAEPRTTPVARRP